MASPGRVRRVLDGIHQRNSDLFDEELPIHQPSDDLTTRTTADLSLPSVPPSTNEKPQIDATPPSTNETPQIDTKSPGSATSPSSNQKMYHRHLPGQATPSPLPYALPSFARSPIPSTLKPQFMQYSFNSPRGYPFSPFQPDPFDPLSGADSYARVCAELAKTQATLRKIMADSQIWQQRVLLLESGRQGLGRTERESKAIRDKEVAERMLGELLDTLRARGEPGWEQWASKYLQKYRRSEAKELTLSQRKVCRMPHSHKSGG